MASQFAGKYKYEKGENLDNYFKALGVNLVARKAMASAKPDLEIIIDGDNWTITTSSMVRKNTNKFRLQEPYEEKMPTGDIIKNVSVFDANNRLVTQQVGPTGSSEQILEVIPDGVVMTLRLPTGVEAKRYFKRV